MLKCFQTINILAFVLFLISDGKKLEYFYKLMSGWARFICKNHCTEQIRYRSMYNVYFEMNMFVGLFSLLCLYFILLFFFCGDMT